MLRNIEVFNLSNLLFLTTFTLPMYMLLNNLVLGVFLFFSLVVSILNKAKPQGGFIKQYLPLLLFFVLAVIASLNNSETFFIKHLEKYFSFLLIPLAFWLLGKNKNLDKLIKVVLKGLTYGCVATLVICYGNVIYEMVTYGEPISYFLRWRHLNHDFTNIADTHPAYLGLFICTSTYYLLFEERKLSNKIKTLICVFFTLGMFQLASRLAMGIYLLVYVLYFFTRATKTKRLAIYFVLFLGLIIAGILFLGSGYLKERMLTTTSIEKDSRFERLNISYNIFKEHPLLGVGLDKIEEERNIRYIDKGFIIAAHHNYNAHNQFMEYLSVNGILGAVIYLGGIIYLITRAIQYRQYFFLFVFISFFLANLTESMLVRIKGIEYFTLFVTLFLVQKRKIPIE
ncbi:O-antigen ligase family protein [Mangrovimonas spongiae]|uniref:O-antigen ligase-related domain-containing protein n=1 Tax=Mangrovimonas spongiae TaxID=2494697 RepID=A0A3R9NTQ2_9FLAO|nr:O-antigen ligase family protein [Mangrovimonas spongiae]RSK41505.1 hypothetical protein EJA19_01120 [Mangrovimonas spongiae]